MANVSVTKEKTSSSQGPTVRTTTYETKTSYDTEIGEPVYRKMLAPRATIIQRTSYGGGPSSGPSSSRSMIEKRTVSYGLNMGVPAGAYQAVTTTGVNAIKDSREQEKKDMQDLNSRFADYIEKVRHLEAQNRKLADDLDKLKQKWGKETTAIKAMFQAELDDARKLLNDAEREKARLEIKCATLEEQIEDWRRQLDELNHTLINNREKLIRQDQQIRDYEDELVILRKRVESLETEYDKDKREIARLTEALNRARQDLDSETLNHIDAENRRQTLEEELEFLKQIHEQEMKELAALAYRDTTPENRDYWKNELAQCLREIQTTYDEKLDLMRGELETYYNMKIQEFRTGATRQNVETTNSKEENKRLRQQIQDMRNKLSDLEARNALLEKELDALRREYDNKEREYELENADLKNEVSKLRSEMEAILRELQDLMDTKLGLELEIAAYRKLLEGEETRIGMRGVIDTMFSRTTRDYRDGGDDSNVRVSQVVKGEMSAKTTYQRSAKGPVSIAETGSDGKFICLENTGRKEEPLGQWKIKRIIDGIEKVDMTLDRNFVLKPGAKVKIWAAGQKPVSAGINDIQCDEPSFGVGANINTKLINPTGEDRATHTQKTIYTS